MRQSESTLNRQRLNRAAAAEVLVANALHLQGWSIICRNLRHIGCELDIVATKMTTLIAVEVKLRQRRPDTMQEMLDLLPAGKREALRRGIQLAAIRAGGQYETIRVDLALVYPDPQKNFKIDYYVNVLD